MSISSPNLIGGARSSVTDEHGIYRFTQLPAGVYAKDVILSIIQRLGVRGGTGYAYEYAGDTIERMTMDERMTICNMSIEGGARAGYVNPDQVTFDYLRGRRFAPQGDDFEKACRWWSSSSCRVL